MDKQGVRQLVKDFTNKMHTYIGERIVEIYLAKNNGKNPNFAEEEEFVIDTPDSLKRLAIKVEVENTYDNEIIVERHKISALKVSLDNSVFVELDGYGDEEFDLSELLADDIIAIATHI